MHLHLRPLTFALTLAGSVLVQSPLGLNAASSPATTTQGDPAQLVYDVVHLSNEERARQGLGPLQPNPSLMQTAQEYAQVLRDGTCFSHDCAAGPRDRARAAGYANYVQTGENIAAGQPSAESVVNDWMASPGHRANILHPSFNEAGVGIALGPGDGTPYWVLVLGVSS
jgi:uncharacterized protein YkwD